MNRNMHVFGDEDLNSVLLATIPKHKDLCCLRGTISFTGNQAMSISNKAYQSQIFKCRCLIFSVPDVIASPVLGAVENIYIIVNKEYYLSGKLKPHLKRIAIQVEDPIPLTNAIYEACLRYTILARLAPSWNQVEKYLVHGRDFLTFSAPLDAVKMDIVINETDMHVVLWPLRLRLPQVCAQDFHSSPHDSPFSWDLSSDSPTVHVLPSLNKAQVLMVSGHIPQNSLFKSYKDLKRHWKNSYGYRLPESDEGIIYLTVSFGRWFTESLTYPIMCVRAHRPVFFRQHEPKKVLMNLLADLHARIPQICGLPFGIDPSVRYAVPKWNVLSEASFPSNLSEEKPVRHDVDKEEDDHVSPEVESQPVSQYTQTQARSRCDFSRGRSISPPPFLPRLSQHLPSAPNKPLYVPVFTAKPKYTCSSTTESPSIPLTPREQADKPGVFGEIIVKPIFGKAHVSQPHNTFHTNKSIQHAIGPKKIKPCPIFNPGPARKPMKEEKTPLQLSEIGNKKVRNRPKVQEGVDVKALAMTRDGLCRVNTTTLIAYLRSEGVSCKVKDKKGELVAKVLAHLKLPLPATVSTSTPQLDHIQADNEQNSLPSQEFGVNLSNQYHF